MWSVGKIKHKIYNGLHPEVGRILMLHRVIPEEQRSRLKANRELEITPQYLEETIQVYREKGYRFVSIDEVYEILKRGAGGFFGKKILNFALDDGYRDNFEIAYPIFKKYNVPFTVNVTTDFIERKALLWWYVLESLGVSDDEFIEYREKIFPLRLEEIQSTFVQWFPNREYSFETIVDQLAMTKDQLMEMSQDPLCTIGCHTVTHSRLDKLAPDNQLIEIGQAKDILSSWLNKDVRHFAYPYGFYNRFTIEMLQKNGFLTAVRTWGGPIRDRSCLELPRINLCQP